MRAINVTSFGTAPTFTNAAPAAANSTDSTTKIKVLAAGLPQLVRSQAAGTHYSVQDAPLPYIPGTDGVGYTADDKLVYFQSLTNTPPGGAFAEYITVSNNVITPLVLPESTQSTDLAAAQRNEAIKVASLFNPFMSSWLALKQRAHVDELKSSSGNSFNVLILGVTSASGRLAALVARHLGAKEIIGVARDATALQALKDSGRIDHTITLDAADPTKTDYGILQKVRVHVALDYVYGPHALALLMALPKSPSKADDLEVRYVHVGSLGRELEIPLPGTLLRSKNVVISGSGPGGWSLGAMKKETGPMVTAIMELVKAENWREEYGVVERKLEDAEEAWKDTKSRSVFVI